MKLLLTYLRLGSLLEEAVRRRVADGLGQNPTALMILITLAGPRGPAIGQENPSKTSVELSAELGFARRRVSMQLESLVAQSLVRVQTASCDARERPHALTSKGLAVAGAALAELQSLDHRLRSEAGIKRRVTADPDALALLMKVEELLRE